MGAHDPLSLARFEQSETVYLSPTEAGNVPEELVGQTVRIENPQTGLSAVYQIAGILEPLSLRDWKEGENFYQNIGPIRDNQAVSQYGKHRIAHIYMSYAGIERISAPPVVNQMSLGSILIIGTVFSLLLLMIGLTNYDNTMATRRFLSSSYW